MAEWTKDPKETGAYWFQIHPYKPNMVWVHNGMVWGIPQMGMVETIEKYAQHGGMFYGPVELPPEMPKTGILLGDFFTHDRSGKSFVCIARPNGDHMVEIARVGG